MFIIGDATAADLLGQIIQLLVGGFSEIATGMGSGIVSMVTSIFMTGANTWTLNVFGTLIVIFASLSLGLSLFRWALNFVTSWGNRNR